MNSHPSLGGITWQDWTRLTASDVGVHGLTDEQVDWLLWERTAFPFAPVTYIRDQLIDQLTRGDRSMPEDEVPPINHRPGEPLEPLDRETIVELARGIATGQMMIANPEEPDWASSLALLFGAYLTGGIPPNVGLIVVPKGPHLGSYWLNGHVPAVTLQAYLVPSESFPELEEAYAEMVQVLYPDRDVTPGEPDT